MNDEEYEKKQWKACVTKTRFASLHEAEVEIKEQRSRRKRLRAYACPVCDQWHLTKED